MNKGRPGFETKADHRPYIFTSSTKDFLPDL
ncbi:hypothetical protein DRA46_06836 [Burkholderia gladioli]|nr:hypothetical protein [Burkholderia gladioli]